MPIEIVCTACRKQLAFADDKAGTSALCPECGAPLHIPVSAAKPGAFDLPLPADASGTATGPSGPESDLQQSANTSARTRTWPIDRAGTYAVLRQAALAPAVWLIPLFLLTFFTWCEFRLGSSSVVRQSAWGAAFGWARGAPVSADKFPALKSAMAPAPDWLTLFYFLVLFSGLAVTSIAFVYGRAPQAWRDKLPPVAIAAWQALVRYEPYLLSAGYVLLFLLSLIHILVRFPMETALVHHAHEILKYVADLASELKADPADVLFQRMVVRGWAFSMSHLISLLGIGLCFYRLIGGSRPSAGQDTTAGVH
ncbi:MAG: hypothetical protein C4296_05865 [Gemmataceae bacterium]